ncbi:MAG: hypothetical protein RL685_1523 [Pseudomonadota bacterium]|jgi:hypothetical protein
MLRFTASVFHPLPDTQGTHAGSSFARGRAYDVGRCPGPAEPGYHPGGWPPASMVNALVERSG